MSIISFHLHDHTCEVGTTIMKKVRLSKVNVVTIRFGNLTGAVLFHGTSSRFLCCTATIRMVTNMEHDDAVDLKEVFIWKWTVGIKGQSQGQVRMSRCALGVIVIASLRKSFS